MEYTARFKSIDARVATLDGDGEKVYLLFERGDVRAVVAQSAFEALYVAKDAEAPVVELPRIPKAVKKTVALQPKAPHPWKKSNNPQAAAPTGGSSVKEQIIALLRKKAYSPLELGEALKRRDDMQSIYVATNLLKGAGQIERFTDDEVDGAPRWRLTETAKGATA